jgi:hypothetical protein
VRRVWGEIGRNIPEKIVMVPKTIVIPAAYLRYGKAGRGAG